MSESSIPVIQSPLPETDELPILESQPRQRRLPVLHQSTPTDTLVQRRVRRLELVILFAIAGFGYFSAQSAKKQSELQDVGQMQTKSLLKLAESIANGNNRVQSLSKSVQAVTTVLAHSTAQMGEISGQLGRRDKQIEKLTVRLQTLEGAARAQQLRTSVQRPVQEPVPNTPDVSHFHRIDSSIPMPAGALAHQNSTGVLEYWLVSRNLSSGDQFVKVVPYSTNADGIRVHSLDDGHDYTLTADGKWIGAPDVSLLATSQRRRRSHRR